MPIAPQQPVGFHAPPAPQGGIFVWVEIVQGLCILSQLL